MSGAERRTSQSASAPVTVTTAMSAALTTAVTRLLRSLAASERLLRGATGSVLDTLDMVPLDRENPEVAIAATSACHGACASTGSPSGMLGPLPWPPRSSIARPPSG